jgi:hypothetical protein
MKIVLKFESRVVLDECEPVSVFPNAPEPMLNKVDATW